MISVLNVNVDAKPAGVSERVTAVAGAVFLQVLEQAGIFSNNGHGQALDALAREYGIELLTDERFEIALGLHLHRPAHHENQIRNTIGALNHRVQQLIKIFFVHDNYS